MSLLELWITSRNQLIDKHIQQLIAIAGDGKLNDQSTGSLEFRSFLSQVPTLFLKKYSSECLKNSFPNSGLALQDIVNELGTRIGATVEPGRYRGSSNQPAHDGLWRFPDGQAIIVEVKTTDAYRIDLDKIVTYRKILIDQVKINAEKSSILVVVGRQDTGDLEAQIRGSRHAWDIRIISVHALQSLLEIKEAVEDPQIVNRIHQILIPREYTRLDAIVEILFSTAEDIQHEDDEVSTKSTSTEDEIAARPKYMPTAFTNACVARISSYLKREFVKRTRAKFSSPDNLIAITCVVSKEHDPDSQPNYWFAFHPHQKEFLEKSSESFIAFGCGSEKQLLLIPYTEFRNWISGMWTTESDDRFYWHVVINREDRTFILYRRKGQAQVDLTKYLLP